MPSDTENNFTPLKASCQCGKSHVTIMAKPIARFLCHCQACQAYTGRGYSDATVVMAKDVQLDDIESTEFKRYKAPPNIRRGKCKHCNTPSIEFGIFDQLAFIPAFTYETPEKLPEPTMHIFYHRRKEDMDDNLPKHEGFLKSQTKVCSLIASGAFSRFF